MKNSMIYTYCLQPIDSRMYVLIEGKKALVIDPCVSDQAMELLRENSVCEVLILLTHEHYDHISGVNWLKDNIERVSVLCSEKCAKALPNPTKNLSAFGEILFVGKSEKMDIVPYSCSADETFENEYRLEWESHVLFLKEVPGHSKGSICIFLDDEILFSGDTLVTGYATITRLPGGDKRRFQEETLPYLRTLNPDIMVYPGHGEAQRLKMWFF